MTCRQAEQTIVSSWPLVVTWWQVLGDHERGWSRHRLAGCALVEETTGTGKTARTTRYVTGLRLEMGRAELAEGGYFVADPDWPPCRCERPRTSGHDRHWCGRCAGLVDRISTPLTSTSGRGPAAVDRWIAEQGPGDGPTGVTPEGRSPAHLRAAVWRVADPDGEMQRARGLASLSLAARDQFREIDRLVDTVVRAVQEFAPHGWAFSGNAPVDAYAAALNCIDKGETIEVAEKHLVEGWANGMSRHLHHRIRRLGGSDPALAPITKARARLVRAAWEHHEAGRYEAVLPLLFAQVDGLVIDATEGRGFFSNHDKATIIDDETIAGLDESLTVARSWFNRSERSTLLAGDGRRHAVLHGRDLGYDTEVNAVRVWALLAAVVDLVTPMYERLISDRRAARELQWAGSDEVDESGRRRDDRGFAEARELLREIYLEQLVTGNMGQPYSTAPRVRRGLDLSAASITVADDGGSWWAATITPSGWVFAIAGAGHDEWLYDGPDIPLGGPSDDTRWGTDDDPPANWTTPADGEV